MYHQYVEVNGARPFVTFNFEGFLYRYAISRIFDEFDGSYTIKGIIIGDKPVKVGTHYLAYGLEKYPEPMFENDFMKLCYSTSLILFKDINGKLEVRKQYPYVGVDLKDITLHEPNKS